MAIDSIEDEAESPFETLRIGNQFVNEGYSNLFGIGEGKQARKKATVDVNAPNFAAQLSALADTFKGADAADREPIKSWLSSNSEFVREVTKKVGVPQDTGGMFRLRWALEFFNRYKFSSKSSCTDIENILAALDEEDTANRQATTGATKKAKADIEKYYLTLSADLRKQVSAAYQSAQCQQQKADAQREAAIKENIGIIQGATAQQAAGLEKQSNMTKYIIFGVGGLVLLAGVVILLKKN